MVRSRRPPSSTPTTVRARCWCTCGTRRRGGSCCTPGTFEPLGASARTPRSTDSYERTARSTSSCWTPRTARRSGSSRTRTTCAPRWGRSRGGSWRGSRGPSSWSGRTRSARNAPWPRWRGRRTRARGWGGTGPARSSCRGGGTTPCSCARTTSTRCSPRRSRRNPTRGSSRRVRRRKTTDRGRRGRSGRSGLGTRPDPYVITGYLRANLRRWCGSCPWAAGPRTITCADSFATTSIQTPGSRGTPPWWRSDRRGGRTPGPGPRWRSMDGPARLTRGTRSERLRAKF